MTVKSYEPLGQQIMMSGNIYKGKTSVGESSRLGQ